MFVNGESVGHAGNIITDGPFEAFGFDPVLDMFGEHQRNFDISLEQISDDGVELADGRRLGPYDQLVLSTGTAARAVPDEALQAGDCIAPRGLWSATNDAAWFVRSL